MRPLRVRRASACSSGAGIECTVRPSASAWRPASRTDELEPDIKTRDEGAERKPLQGVAVVLGDIEHGRRPVPLQAVGRRRRAVELHDDQGPQAAARSRGHRRPGRDFAGSRRRRPHRTRYSRAMPGAMRPSTRTVPAGVATAASRRAVLRIARHPAALHQHHVVGASCSGVTTKKPGRAVHLPVVEIDAVRVEPAALEHDTAVQLFGGGIASIAPVAPHPAPAARRARSAPRAARSSAPRGRAARSPGAPWPAPPPRWRAARWRRASTRAAPCSGTARTPPRPAPGEIMTSP